MSLKTKVAGLAAAAVVAVTGLGIAPAAHADPIKTVMNQVNTQTVQRIQRATDSLGLHIRF